MKAGPGPAPAGAADPAPPRPAGLDEWLAGDAGHLHRSFDLGAVAITSNRRFAGPIVVALKRALRRLLFPLLDVQSSFNSANARLVSHLLERVAEHAGAVEALEQQLSDLRAPPGGLAVPSEALIRRAGWTPGTDVVARYLNDGRAMKDLLVSLVAVPGPGGQRPRVLDFGCGAGKVLRHFAPDAARFELFGCDIDAESIDWLSQHHSSYASFFRVEETPGLPVEGSSFDLIYAVSVFTHLTERWSGWLAELHRVLAPGGLLVATVLGEGMIELERGGEWQEDAIGMNVLRHGQDWQGGGPTVFHSPWWIREHWGRAFEIVEIRQERGPDGSVVRGAHDLVIMRRRDVAVSAELLERIDPADPREQRALAHNIAQLHADDAHLRALLAQAQARGDAEHDQRVDFARRLAAAQAELDQLRRTSG